jgi:uncharacterized membrane protein HdeD (DUF308 family)
MALRNRPNSYVIEDDERHRGWVIGLGVALAILGLVALGASVVTTVLSIGVLGLLLVIGGVIQIVQAFYAPRWSGFFLSALAGVLYLVVGGLTVARPVESAVMLTLLLAGFFLVNGLFRLVVAPVLRMRNWGWVMASGIISVLLGIGIWAQWPVSGLWVIGAFVGIEMVVYGVSLVMLGLALRRAEEIIAGRRAA